VSDDTIEPLGSDTWDAFAPLMERHNGVVGGCWCTWFHTLHGESLDLRREPGLQAAAGGGGPGARRAGDGGR
jgi:hypothetical protein